MTNRTEDAKIVRKAYSHGEHTRRVRVAKDGNVYITGAYYLGDNHISGWKWVGVVDDLAEHERGVQEELAARGAVVSV